MEVLLQRAHVVLPNPCILRIIPTCHLSPPSYVMTLMIHFLTMRIHSLSLLTPDESLDGNARLDDHLDCLYQLICDHNDIDDLQYKSELFGSFSLP